ncbi:MAG: hypothetical protein AAFX78_02940 [Cyanobacteria bacterium J06638_20]
MRSHHQQIESEVHEARLSPLGLGAGADERALQRGAIFLRIGWRRGAIAHLKGTQRFT